MLEGQPERRLAALGASAVAGGRAAGLSAALERRLAGRDLYAVDLDAVVGKYIGETSKNLDRLFEAAAEAGAVLLFDEADALLGKRSEVKDAHDRYANIEVAYLLQRIEDFDGIAILATNRRGNIDEGFRRRMQFVVEFPYPGRDDD